MYILLLLEILTILLLLLLWLVSPWQRAALRNRRSKRERNSHRPRRRRRNVRCRDIGDVFSFSLFLLVPSGMLAVSTDVPGHIDSTEIVFGLWLLHGSSPPPCPSLLVLIFHVLWLLM